VGRLTAVLGVNHIAFRTPDAARLRRFYLELLGGEDVDGAHGPVRIGSTLLVFFEGDDPIGADELAFDVDAAGFDEVAGRAERLGAIERGPIDHNDWSRGLYLRDPDGRRLEITYNDHGAFWRE
jgi:catechol 2,3-dioxygenase-like lactoylglutathione lyase family enzyme